MWPDWKVKNKWGRNLTHIITHNYICADKYQASKNVCPEDGATAQVCPQVVTNTYCTTQSGTWTCSMGTISASSSRLCTYWILFRNFILWRKRFQKISQFQNTQIFIIWLFLKWKTCHIADLVQRFLFLLYYLIKGLDIARTVRINHVGWAMTKDFRFFLSLQSQHKQHKTILHQIHLGTALVNED